MSSPARRTNPLASGEFGAMKNKAELQTEGGGIMNEERFDFGNLKVYEAPRPSR